MCSSYPAHKNTYLSASSCPIPTQLGKHHLPMYVDPPALLSAFSKGCRNHNMDIHEHPLLGPISQKRVRRFSPIFAHRSFTIIPTGVPICSPKFRAHGSSNSLFHGSRSRELAPGLPWPTRTAGTCYFPLQPAGVIRPVRRAAIGALWGTWRTLGWLIC